jgi:hypothetical protein
MRRSVLAVFYWAFWLDLFYKKVAGSFEPATFLHSQFLFQPGNIPQDHIQFLAGNIPMAALLAG